MLYTLDRIEFLLSEAIIALRRNGWMTFSAVTTVAVALYLIGSFGYAYNCLSDYAHTLPSKFEMRVFLKEDVTSDQIQETSERISHIKGIQSVNLIPKEEAWELQKKEMPDVTEGLENPLPDAYKITLKDLKLAPSIIDKIKSESIVDENGIAYFDEEHQFLTQILDLVKKLGFILGGLMFITGGVLIYNTIRLTIVSRRKEMRIMQLIGSTSSTVVIPLLIEGILQGALGGIIAAIFLISSHMSLSNMLTSFSALGQLTTFPTGPAFIALATIGAIYGLICSAFSVAESKKKKR